ncbi:alpha/beta hydrolase [Thalassotalea euphylliae]|uniref:alpha/beta hydrolase n=1 Tax=Thalassotalea euphylliae TaxID=1655234 RepID=UPI00362D63AD
MRGTVSEKLVPFLEPVNNAIAEMKRLNLPYEVDTTRENLEKLSQFMSESVAVALVEDRVLHRAENPISVRVYNPTPENSLPVILHYHGGGHMCGSIDLYDPICRRLAMQSGAIVIAVDYRLAPEHPYPAGIDDCQYALEHYQSVIEDMKSNGELIIVGDSAGGAICTTLAMNNQASDGVKIDKQVLIYPSVDYTMSCPSVLENGNGFLLEKEKVDWYFDQYFQNQPDDSIRRLASPMFGRFSQQLPQSLVFTAGCDPLRDEGRLYVQQLRDNQVSVCHHQLDDMIHAFMLLHDLVKDECDQVYVEIAKFIANN